MTSGVTVGEGLLQRRVVVGAQVRLLLTQRRDLPLLEVGLGDDLAIHLHQHLLDDVRLRPRARPAAPARLLAQGKCHQQTIRALSRYFAVS